VSGRIAENELLRKEVTQEQRTWRLASSVPYFWSGAESVRERQAEEIAQMTSNVEHSENSENTNRPKSGLVGKILIGGALAAALGGWWYQSSQVASVRQELAQAQQKMDQLHGQMETSIAVAKTEVNETIARMNEQVEKARREALDGSHRAQIAAQTAAKRQA
jgi:hypothetical protein